MNTSKEMKTKKMRAAGFTLVEIMIVVAIIGLLIGVAVPKFSQCALTLNRPPVSCS